MSILSVIKNLFKREQKFEYTHTVSNKHYKGYECATISSLHKIKLEFSSSNIFPKGIRLHPNTYKDLIKELTAYTDIKKNTKESPFIFGLKIIQDNGVEEGYMKIDY